MQQEHFYFLLEDEPEMTDWSVALDGSENEDFLLLDLDAALEEILYQESEDAKFNQAWEAEQARKYWEGECGGCLNPRYVCTCEEEL